MFLKLLTFLLPWRLRRLALQKWFKYQIHPSANIGWSWIFPDKLIMAENSKIGHFNVALHLESIEIGINSTISRGNWITGFTTGSNSRHFAHQTNRQAKLKMGENSAITKNHHIDCTNVIEIGSFATIAGYNSQFLTHSINVFENRQDSAPIIIGDYTFVGTNVVILGGAVLPQRSVLAAKSLLNKQFSEEWTTYGGVPAKPINTIPQTAKYFTRTVGYVY